jgi:hypothetical protein
MCTAQPPRTIGHIVTGSSIETACMNIPEPQGYGQRSPQRPYRHTAIPADECLQPQPLPQPAWRGRRSGSVPAPPAQRGSRVRGRGMSRMPGVLGGSPPGSELGFRERSMAGLDGLGSIGFEPGMRSLRWSGSPMTARATSSSSWSSWILCRTVCGRAFRRQSACCWGAPCGIPRALSGAFRRLWAGW